MNLKIDRILFATDFLENSRLALDYAVCFAQHFKASILMMHVLFPSQAALEAEVTTSCPSASRVAAQQRLETLAEGVRRLGLTVETHVVTGFTCDTILQSVKTYKADLLVLGTHGVHRGLDHLLIGSNTEKILLSAECPTLTVGAHVMAGFSLSNHLREIVYFSDFTPEAAAAAPYAILLGKEFGVPVEVCHLFPAAAENNPKIQSELANSYCESVKAVIGDVEAEWCSPAFQIERGMELDQIVERAETQDAGMIILGVHAASHLGRHLHTSFAYQVLSRASCPIFTVRNKVPSGPEDAR